VAGGVTGDNLGYALGRQCKRRAHTRLTRRVRPDNGMGRAQDFLLRHGGTAMFTGRFIGFVRAFLPFAAGASGLPYRRFLFFSTLASLVWGIGNVLLGCFAGAAVTELLHSVGLIAVVGLVAAGVVVLAVVRLRRRRRSAIRARSTVVASGGPARSSAPGQMHMFWNWNGRSQEEIEQARTDWMTGTRFGEMKGYDGDPLPAPELPPVPPKPRGRVR
jgi:membrane-associated protein